MKSLCIDDCALDTSEDIENTVEKPEHNFSTCKEKFFCVLLIPKG